jgi:pantetheine-phosphate adenylyltransferase
LKQAEQIFDKVVVAFGINPDKEIREISVPNTISNREVIKYDNFLSHVLNRYEEDGCNITLIRGLRNEYDLNYEQNLVQYIKDQKHNLKVVFLLCNKEYEHISSGSIRSLNKFDPTSTMKYVVS